MSNNEALLKDYKRGDLSARDRLCSENMGLVVSIARRFSCGGVDVEDLAQTGSMGLLKAIDNFDESFGVKFSTYAVPMIIGEIRRFLRDDGILKVSRSIKERAYKGYTARDELSKKLGREPTIAELSEYSEISVEDLLEAFDATTPPDSINRSVYYDSESELCESLKSSDSEEKIVDRIMLENMLGCLEKRERQILLLRYFKGKTQQEIADCVGVSQVQVSRIEKKALEKIRNIHYV